MITAYKRDPRSAWLGGEAHVRWQEDARFWRLPPEWRQGLSLLGTGLLGSLLGGGIAAVACRQAQSYRISPPYKGEPPMRTRSAPHRQASPMVPLLAAFAAGIAVGAGLALFSAPHSGHEMRRRLACGAKTAQEELSDVLEDTREAVGALTKDARQTLKRTAVRLTEVIAATREALKADAGAPERTTDE